MPTTVNTLISALEAVAPPALAESWDHVGLQVGAPLAPVSTVLLTVDCTPEVVAQATARGAQLIVAHHPLLFSPLSEILVGEPVAEVVYALIRAGLGLYAAHTNLDVAPEIGTAAALAAVLGLVDPQPLAAGCAEGLGAGRVGALPEPLTAGALAAQVCRQLQAPAVTLHGLAETTVTRLAAIPGAGGEGLAEAAAVGAQVLVTGELKHHELLAARARGLTVILAGHAQTERPVLPRLQDYLTRTLPGLTVECAEENRPQSTVTA